MDEHDRYYHQWRTEYLRRLDADYRAWLEARRRKLEGTASSAPERPQFGGPPPFEPAHGHEASAAESLGRAVSSVIMGSAAHTDAANRRRGGQDAPAAGPDRPVSRSREDR